MSDEAPMRIRHNRKTYYVAPRANIIWRELPTGDLRRVTNRWEFDAVWRAAEQEHLCDQADARRY